MRLLVSNAVRLMRFSTKAVPEAESAFKLKPDKETTDLHHLKTQHKNPFSLFKEWYEEYQSPNYIASKALTFSTANKKGQISSRTLLLRRLDEDGMVIMTDNRSRKAKDLKENPYASMVFLWATMNDDVILSRQARAEGKVTMLSTEDMSEIFEVEPLFCKIRAHICHQGTPVNWNEMKKNHDTLLQKFENNQHDLAKPDHVVAYKLIPSTIEFYESQGQTIADRLIYVKNGNEWDIVRIAA